MQTATPSIHDLLQNPTQVRERYPIHASHRYRSFSLPATSSSGIRGYLPQFLRGSKPQHEDTPTASLYRLYEFLVVDWTTQLRNELEYFCRTHPTWAVADIPDPSDPDPQRYAVLAVLTKLMCAAFNRRIDLGLPRDAPAIIEDFEELANRPRVHEQPPAWALVAAPLSETLFLPEENGAVLAPDDPDASEEFKAMNIIIRTPHIHFV